jgi:hypothetical protein
MISTVYHKRFFSILWYWMIIAGIYSASPKTAGEALKS